eukprot:6492775-Amphidinium_carterae.2
MPLNNQLWVSWLDKSKEYFKNQMDMAPCRDTHVCSQLARIKPARSKAPAWEAPSAGRKSTLSNWGLEC